MDYDEKSLNSMPTMGPGGIRNGGARRPAEPFEEHSIGSAPTMGGRTTPQGGRLRPGDVLLGRYTMLAELGEGGMGVVYKCLDTIGGIEVAIKCLPPELSRNESEMEGIRENYAIVARLHHSAISGLRQLEKDSEFGEYYLVMDLAKGEDLSTILRRRRGVPMPLDEALAILRPLASALDYAHGEHVLHRDVKPANVKVDGSRVQLLDFGLAAEVRSSMSRVSLRGHAGSSGTPAYMAPEQWEARRQSAATDQYSLAVMAYEMLAGYRPFDTDNMELLKSAVLTRAPEEIEGVPAHVNAALQKALAKNPKDRFASCIEFVEAIASAKGDDESIAAHGNIVEESSMLLLSATVNNAGVSGATLSVWGQSIALPAKLELDYGTIFGPGTIEFRDGNGAAYAADIGQLQVDWRGERAVSVPLAVVNRNAGTTKKTSYKPSLLAILLAIGVVIVGIVAIGKNLEARRAKNEAIRIAAEQVERERIVLEQAEAERQRLEAEAKRLAQMEAERKLAAERKAVEARKAEEEAKRKARDEAAKKAESDRKVSEETAMAVHIEPSPYQAGERKVIKIGSWEVALRWCPPGTFTMGSPTFEEGRDDDETQHRVTLSHGFWMGETEVTQGLWKEVMGDNPWDNPSHFKTGDNYPVDMVSWDGCQNFLRKLNAHAPQGGFKWTLPTEAQWEFACRAGSTTAYSWGNALNGDRANCNGKKPCGITEKGPYKQKTTSVGSYAANAWGLYDMHGNVSEWCADWYGDYSSAPVTDPTGPSSGSGRVYRGGAWIFSARHCRSSKRAGDSPSGPGLCQGFRIALVPVQ